MAYAAQVLLLVAAVAAFTVPLSVATDVEEQRSEGIFGSSYAGGTEICEKVHDLVAEAVAGKVNRFDQYRQRKLSIAATLLVRVLNADTRDLLPGKPNEFVTKYNIEAADRDAIRRFAVKQLNDVKSFASPWNEVGDILQQNLGAVDVDPICRDFYGKKEEPNRSKFSDESEYKSAVTKWEEKFSAENCYVEDPSSVDKKTHDFCKCVIAVSDPLVSWFMFGGSFVQKTETKMQLSMSYHYALFAQDKATLPVGKMFERLSLLDAKNPGAEFPGSQGMSEKMLLEPDGPCTKDRLAKGSRPWVRTSGDESFLPFTVKDQLNRGRCLADWRRYRSWQCRGVHARTALCREPMETDIVDEIITLAYTAEAENREHTNWMSYSFRELTKFKAEKSKFCSTTFKTKKKGANAELENAPQVFTDARRFFNQIHNRQKAAMSGMSRLMRYLETRGGKLVKQAFEKDRAFTASMSLAVSFKAGMSFAQVVGMYAAVQLPLVKWEGTTGKSSEANETPESRGLMGFVANKALSKLGAEVSSISSNQPFRASRTFLKGFTVELGIVVKLPGAPFLGSSVDLTLGVEVEWERTAEHTTQLSTDATKMTHASYKCSFAVVKTMDSPSFSWWSPMISDSTPRSSAKCAADGGSCLGEGMTCCNFPQVTTTHMPQDHRGFCVPEPVSKACCHGAGNPFFTAHVAKKLGQMWVKKTLEKGSDKGVLAPKMRSLREPTARIVEQLEKQMQEQAAALAELQHEVGAEQHARHHSHHHHRHAQ